eukprot:TRINITY_DN6357_c0_g1_i2.p1 TRINITY_DN6357_c0_g1~~TRINITY_DN6357_c0_g1_i2.p1  ORF type:complete len:1381 (-),score=555.48 TRINITY_DN6357_c0_g1_i2:301-4443(-)
MDRSGTWSARASRLRSPPRSSLRGTQPPPPSGTGGASARRPTRHISPSRTSDFVTEGVRNAESRIMIAEEDSLASIKQYIIQVQNLRVEIEQKDRLIHELRVQVEDLFPFKGEAEAMRSELAANEERFLMREREAKNVIDDMIQTIEEHRETEALLRQKVGELEQNKEETQKMFREEIGELEAKVQALFSDGERREASRRRLEAELENCAMELKTRQKEFGEREYEMRDMQQRVQENSSRLTAQLKVSEMHLAECEERRREAEMRVRERDQVVAKMEAVLDESAHRENILKEQNRRMKEEIAAMDEKTHGLAMEAGAVPRLKSELEQIPQLHDDVARLRSKSQNLAESLEMEKMERQKLENENVRLQHVTEDLEKRLQETLARYRGVTSPTTELADKRRKVELLNAEIERLMLTCETLKGDLEKERDRFARMQSRFDEVGRSLAGDLGAIQRIVDRALAGAGNPDDVRFEPNPALDALPSSKAQLIHLWESVRHMISEVPTVRLQVSALKHDLRDCEERVAQKEREVVRLESELRERKVLLEEHESILEEANEKCSQQHALIKEQERTIQEIETKYDTQRRSLRSLHSRLGTLESAMKKVPVPVFSPKKKPRVSTVGGESSLSSAGGVLRDSAFDDVDADADDVGFGGLRSQRMRREEAPSQRIRISKEKDDFEEDDEEERRGAGGAGGRGGDEGDVDEEDIENSALQRVALVLEEREEMMKRIESLELEIEEAHRRKERMDEAYEELREQFQQHRAEADGSHRAQIQQMRNEFDQKKKELVETHQKRASELEKALADCESTRSEIQRALEESEHQLSVMHEKEQMNLYAVKLMTRCVGPFFVRVRDLIAQKQILQKQLVEQERVKDDMCQLISAMQGTEAPVVLGRKRVPRFRVAVICVLAMNRLWRMKNNPVMGPSSDVGLQRFHVAPTASINDVEVLPSFARNEHDTVARIMGQILPHVGRNVLSPSATLVDHIRARFHDHSRSELEDGIVRIRRLTVQLSQAMREMEDRNAELTRRNEEKTTIVEDMDGRIGDMEQQIIKGKDLVAFYEEKVQELQTQILRMVPEKKYTDVRDLQEETAKKLKSIQREKERLETDLHECAEKLDSCERGSAELRHKLAEQEERSEKLEQELQTQSEELESVHEFLKQKAGEMTQLEESEGELRRELQAREAELETNVNELEAVKSEFVRLEKQLKQSELTCDDVEQALQAREENIERLEGRIRELRDALVEKERELLGNQEMVQTLSEAHARSSKDLAALQEEMIVLRAQYDEVTSELDGLRDRENAEKRERQEWAKTRLEMQYMRAAAESELRREFERSVQGAVESRRTVADSYGTSDQLRNLVDSLDTSIQRARGYARPRDRPELQSRLFDDAI